MTYNTITPIVADFVINEVGENEQFQFDTVIAKFDYRKYRKNMTAAQAVEFSFYNCPEAISYMIKKGLIEKIEDQKYRLSDLSVKIKPYKSYDAYSKSQEDKVRLEWYTTRNAKRIYATYWWTFGFAVAGFLISAYLLWLKIREPIIQAHLHP